MSRELKNSYLSQIFSVLDCKVMLLTDSNRGTVGLFLFPNVSEACCIGLAWSGFGSRGIYGCLLWEAARGFLHVWQSQSLSTPKMELAKAGPIRSYASVSGITYLRRREGKKSLCSCNFSQKRVKWEHVMGTRHLQTPGSVGKEGQEVLQVMELRFVPLQPVVHTMVRQLGPCSPWGSTGMHRSTCSPSHQMCEGDAWREAVTPW